MGPEYDAKAGLDGAADTKPEGQLPEKKADELILSKF
jgi:hypothetical protein